LSELFWFLLRLHGERVFGVHLHADLSHHSLCLLCETVSIRATDASASVRRALWAMSLPQYKEHRRRDSTRHSDARDASPPYIPFHRRRTLSGIGRLQQQTSRPLLLPYRLAPASSRPYQWLDGEPFSSACTLMRHTVAENSDLHLLDSI
jgi:hypothetical protein